MTKGQTYIIISGNGLPMHFIAIHATLKKIKSLVWLVSLGRLNFLMQFISILSLNRSMRYFLNYKNSTKVRSNRYYLDM